MVVRTPRTLKKLLLALSLLATTPQFAHAETPKIADDEHYDGRVQGYEPDVELASSSNGLSWFLVIAMGGVCVAVIFKDAKRTHLD